MTLPSEKFSPAQDSPRRAVVIGASAGALDALSALLPMLPRDYPMPLFAVVHLPPDKKSMIASLLAAKCQIAVQEAEDKEVIHSGRAYFAPPDYHLLVEADNRLSLSSEEPVLFSRPSIDVLFESAADVYGAGLVGIILTGANSDGASGLKAVMAAGGTGLVQRPDRAYSEAMPQAAVAACPNARSMSIEEIGAYLLETSVTK